MLNNTVNTLREERAKFSRDVEYLKETAIDDELDERVEVAESQYFGETIDELTEAASMVSRLTADVDEVEESAEVERILAADEDLTFAEMAGIEE